VRDVLHVDDLVRLIKRQSVHPTRWRARPSTWAGARSILSLRFDR
jgi:hypothetical protein